MLTHWKNNQRVTISLQSSALSWVLANQFLVILCRVSRAPPLSLQYICVSNNNWNLPFVVMPIRSFPHLWITTRFVNRATCRLPLVQQELLTLPKHLSAHHVHCGVRVTRSFVFCVVYFQIIVSPLVLFFLVTTALFVLQLRASDYPFGIIKLFVSWWNSIVHLRIRQYRERTHLISSHPK